MTLYERKIEQNAIEHYGRESQMVVAIEELSELVKELTKNLRGENNEGHIAEEIADVHIMLDQLELMFENVQSVRTWKERKINRLNARIHSRNK